MKSSDRPELGAQLAEQLEHRRLHRDVERGGDLVADEEVGPRRERARDRDALALAARELAREAPGESGAAGAPARAAPRPRPAPPRSDRPRRTRAGRAIASATRWRGLSESYGFWKTIWIRRRASLGRSFALAASSSPSSVIRPPAGGCRPAMQRAIVVLPLPDSPTSATHSPGGERERDVLGGDHRVDAAVDGAQPLDRKQRRLLGDAAHLDRAPRPRGQASAATRSSARAVHRPQARAGAAPPRSAPRAAGSAVRTRSRAGARRRRRPPRACRAAGAARRGRGSRRRGRACTDGAARRARLPTGPPRRRGRRT